MTTTSQLIESLDGCARVVDLARQYVHGMAQSPNHPPYRHAYTRRHGDVLRADGGSAAADMLTMGMHVGTHIDALAHVSHDGRLHGGVAVDEALRDGLYQEHGVHRIPPFVGRGVLLDIPALHGVAVLDGGYEITPEDLLAAEDRQHAEIRAGDAVLIRSGWGTHWASPEAYVGLRSGVPGPGAAAAELLAERGVALVGADTIAFERLAPGAGHSVLPAHRVLLVGAGIPIMETLALDDLAELAVATFGLVVAPLNVLGATGSPIRPLALLGAEHR